MHKSSLKSNYNCNEAEPFKGALWQILIFDYLCLFIFMNYLCLSNDLAHMCMCVLKLPGSQSSLLAFPCCTDAFGMSHVLFWIKIYLCHSMLSLSTTTQLENFECKLYCQKFN